MKDNIFSKKEFWLNYYDLMTDWEKENSKIRVVEDAFMCGYDSRQNEINELKKQIESLTKAVYNQCTCFGRYICNNCDNLNKQD